MNISIAAVDFVDVEDLATVVDEEDPSLDADDTGDTRAAEE